MKGEHEHQRDMRWPSDSCEWCSTHPYSQCVACIHRGRHALKLTELQGLTIEQAADKMILAPGKVRRLIDAELDRRDLARYRCDRVPVEEIQKLLEERISMDPTLTHAKIARLAKFKSRIHFERVLGYAPHSAMTKRGKHYPAKYATSIDVHTAGVIVRALGIAPHEVPAL
jgi:hypothetical protein